LHKEISDLLKSNPEWEDISKKFNEISHENINPAEVVMEGSPSNALIKEIEEKMADSNFMDTVGEKILKYQNAIMIKVVDKHMEEDKWID